MWLVADEERGCDNGDVRLDGGVGPSDGRVEVCLDRRWGAVCSDGWNTNNSRVVCGQLNFDPEGVCTHY